MNRKKWDLHAREFETRVCDITADASDDRLTALVQQACRSRKNLVLVDLGCGIGSFVRKFGNRFREIFALDYAPRLVNRARKRCANVPGVTWFATDIGRSSKLIGCRADLTVCLNVITSPNEATRDALWSSIAAVTKPSGFALIVVPSAESEKMVRKFERNPGHDLKNGVIERDGAPQKHFARGELVSTLSERGFAIKQIKRAPYPWSTEGLRKPRLFKTNPWDWVCLVQRIA